METVIIPVLLSFFLGPGVGQLYNKEYKKGILFILISFAVLIGVGLWYFKAMQPLLPPDVTTMDPAAMQELLKNAAAQLNAKDGAVLSFFEAVLTVMWLYGVVDAYLGAKKKAKS